MKLIIEIPEDLYEGIERRDGALETEYVCDELMKAVDNGTPSYNSIKTELEPCDDAISRQAVLEKAICVPIARVVTEDKVIYRKIVFVDEIENIPPVTHAEKVGKWISNAEDDLKISEYTCSNCKGLSDEDSDFCPKCGSRMIHEVKDERD